ncbi:MAG: hypothetical protein LW870_09705 [Pirellula sp.]|nr:hypothetical protein [Pirellula sp.]
MAKKSTQRDDVEKELADLNQKAGDLMEKSHCRSSYRLFGELRQRAKSENSLVYYVFGTFFQMNLAQRLFQFETVRERAIELIAIFENEEQARKIEPELSLEEYEGIKYSMCACAYEVLAEATGDLEGYNSEGMQECLTGGIEVCQRIGKLSCIGCFREYACDIHRAADDSELARYHCNQVLKQAEDFSDRGDRRWLATLKLGSIDILEGQHDIARQKIEKAYELSQSAGVNDSHGARISTMLELHMLDLLDDRPPDPRFTALLQKMPARDECPEYDYDVDCLAALHHTLAGEWDEGEKLLIDWSRLFKQSKATTRWLETGIRIVASKRLRGDLESAKRIAAPLEMAATKANDWQSLRRLNQCLDSHSPVTPIGTVIRNSRVLNSRSTETTKTSTDSRSMADSESEQPPTGYYEISKTTPLYEWLEDYAKRLQASRELPPDQVDIEAFRSELLDSQNRDWSHPEDIGRALYFMCYLVTPESDYRLIWTWANRLVSSHQETGYLVSLLARLGMSINAAERFEQFSKIDFENFDEDLPPALIESERLDQLVRKSLQLDSAGVNNNFRAGEIFEYIDNLGESERCYARAFKLDRKREDAALALARIYTNSDRNSDAHYVLDLCIREGGSSSDLYFEAAMRAHSLSMHELQVSYLRTLLEKFLPIPWAYYYMSIGLLELKKPEEAIESIELEIEKFEGNGVHIESILAEANALLHRTQQAEEAIERGLSFALCDTEDLTNGGIASAIERLWRASRLLPSAGKLRNRLEKRMLKAGIATEEYFADLRADQKPKDLFLFHVSLLQPLDEHWVEFEGCLPDQTDWGSYIAHWGVLADDEEQAEQYAIEMQSQCYSLEAEVMDVSQDEEPLHDRPGVAFQGFRTSGDEMSGEEDDFDDDENPF